MPFIKEEIKEEVEDIKITIIKEEIKEEIEDITIPIIKEECVDVKIEDSFRVKQETTEEQTVPRIFIIGDNYICHGEKHANDTIGTDLGLRAQVHWFGSGGLVWRNLLPFFHQCLRGRAVPDFLLIHCGGNDLGIVRSVEIVQGIKQDLEELHRQFPQMKLIFSAITERCRWGSACPKKINKVRRFVNKMMARFILSIGGSILHHPQIKHNRGHFMHDGVQLTLLANDIFVKNIALCLREQIH